MEEKKTISIPEGIEALIFDLDGTLADNMQLHYEAWKASCEYYELDCNKEKMLAYAGLSTIKIAGDLLMEKYGKIEPGMDKEMADMKAREFEKRRPLAKAMEGVAEVVNRYLGKMPMAVGTGGSKEGSIKTLEHIKMEDKFQALVSADDVENHKPEPDTFLKCAELIGAEPSKCLVFEDGDRGIEAAKRAGMKYIDIRVALGKEW